MKAVKVILALLLIFAFSTSAFAADVLIQRFENANLYSTGENTRRLDMGGDVENALPFDGGTEYVPWNLIFAEGTPVGNWTWLGKGTIGYLIKPSLSIVRMYPVRGDQTKFIEIAPIAAQPSIVNQISPKSLELYVDQPNTRWSLSMTPQGFKPNILLKPGYSGDGTFQFRFELNGGLILDGARIMDGATEVLKMHNPFLIDANGIERAVSESLADGIVTLIANISGLTKPILVDPTLGPIGNSKDTRISEDKPLHGFGQSTVIQIRNEAGLSDRGLLLFDISAIPAGATVTSNILSIFHNADAVGTVEGKSLTLARCTRTDWNDQGAQAGTLNAEANWTNYLTAGPTAWTSAGGDYTSTDSVTHIAGAVGTWDDINAVALGQDALDNRAGLYSILLRFTNINVDVAGNWRTREFSNVAQRPKLTIEYIEDIINHAIKPWCKGVYYENRPCLPFGSLFPNK